MLEGLTIYTIVQQLWVCVLLDLFYFLDKYKAFDVQSLEYDILKELDSNIKPDLNEEFMIRMEKDVERRIKKDETIKTIVKEKQVTLQEEDRVKTFNRRENEDC